MPAPPAGHHARRPGRASRSRSERHGNSPGEAMGSYTTKDGVDIFFKDWGSGQPVVFSHGWPLTADAWDPQLRLVADAGFRAIAHDRRGGGRSSQPWEGNDPDHLRR